MATFQPWPTSPSTWASGTNTSSKKISAKPVSPSIWGMGRTVTPGLSMRDEEIGQPPVPLGLGVGAEQPEAPLGEGAAGRPGLLTGEQPPVVAGGAQRPGCGCRPGRYRRRARTTPGTRSPLPRPWPAGSVPSAGRSRTRTGSGPAGTRRSGSPARVPGPASTPPRRSSHSRIPTPRPPYSSGHETTDQRSSYMARSHSAMGLEPVRRVQGGERTRRRGMGGQPRARLMAEGLLGRGDVADPSACPWSGRTSCGVGPEI